MTAPIWILGIMPRCGTHFLWDLLALHPQCEAVQPLGDVPEHAPAFEDWLLASSDPLRVFVREVCAEWGTRWAVPRDMEARLLAGLGMGLLAAVTDGSRPLLKTPSVRNLEHFFRLFPTASLIVLVRDGRAVVESTIRSFYRPWGFVYERFIHEWADAAQAVTRFQSSATGRFRLVRYEDLVANMEGEMRALLAFLELDAARYDFEAARDLPVRGASQARQDGQAMTWRPMPKSMVQPAAAAWESWPPALVERFNWVAGDGMAHFGYPCTPRSSGPMRQHLLDALWAVRRLGLPMEDAILRARRLRRTTLP